MLAINRNCQLEWDIYKKKFLSNGMGYRDYIIKTINLCFIINEKMVKKISVRFMHVDKFKWKRFNWAMGRYGWRIFWLQG